MSIFARACAQVTRRRLSALAALGWTCAIAPAMAQSGFTSAYTDLNLDRDCLVLEADDFGVSWACPGYKGYPVHVSEGDLRFTAVYGFIIDAEPGGQTMGDAGMAAEQSIGALDAGGHHCALPHCR